jgi:hypothetical protein
VSFPIIFPYVCDQCKKLFNSVLDTDTEGIPVDLRVGRDESDIGAVDLRDQDDLSLMMLNRTQIDDDVDEDNDTYENADTVDIEKDDVVEVNISTYHRVLESRKQFDSIYVYWSSQIREQCTLKFLLMWLIIIILFSSLSKNILKMCVLWNTSEWVRLLVCILTDFCYSLSVDGFTNKRELLCNVCACTRHVVKIAIDAKVDCIAIG